MNVALRPVTPDDDGFLYDLYVSTREDELSLWGWGPAQRDVFLKMQFAGQNAQHSGFENPDHQIILLNDGSNGIPISYVFMSWACTKPLLTL